MLPDGEATLDADIRSQLDELGAAIHVKLIGPSELVEMVRVAGGILPQDGRRHRIVW
jgi:hypothetical protein